MDLNELENYFASLPDKIMEDSAEIVAETAVSYYKETFRKKAFDGNPWAPAKVPKKTGSLLISSGALLNSIRPAYIGKDKVVISAGNGKVNYAQTHNEGYQGSVQVPAHVRHTSRYGDVNVRAHSRQANIPARPFMADSSELNEEIKKRIDGYIDSLK